MPGDKKKMDFAAILRNTLTNGITPNEPIIYDCDRIMALSRETQNALDNMQYISFDCGIKTFAYCIINAPFDIMDFGVVDLSNGKADKDIHTVERIHNIIRYLREHVDVMARQISNIPITPDRRVKVLVEYQMGQNPHAKACMDAIIAHYYGHEVIVVGPSLKNKICLGEGCDYASFTGKTELYTANKNHTKANFLFALRRFAKTEKVVEKKLLSHVSDAYCQAVGYHLYGDKDQIAF